MKKRSELVIRPSDFCAFLLGVKGNKSFAEFATQLGISSNLLYRLVSGERLPSQAILKKLGGEVVYSFAPERMTTRLAKKSVTPKESQEPDKQ